MATHYIGLSGYASPASRLVVEAPRQAAEDLLACYAQEFSCVEMDSAFSRPPSAQTVRTWQSVAGDDFRWVVRMSRDATHVHQLRTPAAVVQVLADLSLLGPQLSCVLFTTPPHMRCDPSLLANVLKIVPGGLRTAWEFRHPSWICAEVLDMLVEHDSAPVVVETLDGVTYPELLPEGELGQKWDLPFCYVRLRRERYRAAEVMAWGETLDRARQQGGDVFAFFRQSHEAAAYARALEDFLSEP